MPARYPKNPNLDPKMPESTLPAGANWRSPPEAMEAALLRSAVYGCRAVYYYRPGLGATALHPKYGLQDHQPTFLVEVLAGWQNNEDDSLAGRQAARMYVATVIVNRCLFSAPAADLPKAPMLVWRNKDTGAVQVLTHGEGRPLGALGGRSSRWVRIASIVPVAPKGPQKSPGQRAVEASAAGVEAFARTCKVPGKPRPAIPLIPNASLGVLPAPSIPVTQVSPEVFQALSQTIEKHGVELGGLKLLAATPENLEKVQAELVDNVTHGDPEVKREMQVEYLIETEGTHGHKLE